MLRKVSFFHFLSRPTHIYIFTGSCLAVAGVFVLWAWTISTYYTVILWLVIHNLLAMRCSIGVCVGTRGHGWPKVQSHIPCFHLRPFILFHYSSSFFSAHHLPLHLTRQPCTSSLALDMVHIGPRASNIEIAVILLLKWRVVPAFVDLINN